MRSVMIFIVSVFLSNSTLAQEEHWQKTVLHFDIQEAELNGEDYSKLFLSQKTYLAFYKVDTDSVLLLSLVNRKDASQTWGRVYPHPVIFSNEMYDGFKSERTYYRWNYHNSFNENSGSALIELIKVPKPEGLFYVMKVFVHEFDLAVYKGYMNVEESDVVKVLDKGEETEK